MPRKPSTPPSQNRASSVPLAADRFRALVDGFADPLLLLDGDHLIRYANRAFLRLFGYQLAEVSGQPHTLIVPSGDIDLLAAHLAVLQPGLDDPLTFECRVVRRDGKFEIVAATLNSLPDPQGPPMIVLHLHLVTAQKQAEEALKAEQLRFTQVAATVPGAITVLRSYSTGQFKLLYASQNFEEIFGLALADLETNAVAILQRIPPTDVGVILAQLTSLELSLQPAHLEFRYDHPLKGEIWIENRAQPMREADGSVVWYGVSSDITARKQAEEKLRESERRFTTIFENSPVAIGISRLSDGRVLHVNSAFTSLYGCTREEAIGKTTLELGIWANPADRQRFMDLLAAYQSVSSLEVTARRKSGEESQVLIWGEHIELNGEPCLMAQMVNITERKHVEEALEQMRNTLAEAQKIAYLGSFEYLASTQTTVWSEEEYRIYGLDPAEPSPTYAVMLEKCIHPEDAALLDVVFTTALQNSSAYELEHRIVHPDGSVRWVYDRARPYFDEQGKLVRYVGVTLDITDRKHAEEKLRESESRFATLFRSNPVPVALTRVSDYRIVDVNDAWSLLTGYSREQALNRTSVELGLTDPQAIQQARKLLQTQREIRQHEIPLYTRAGQERRVLISAELLEMDGEAYYINSLLDITERKQAEEKLRESETLLRQVLESIPDTTFALDQDYRLLINNQRHQKELVASGGHPFSVGEPVLSPDYPPEILDFWQTAYDRALAGGQFSLESTWTDLQGQVHVHENRFSPLRDASDVIIGALVFAHDITERKQAETLLQQQTEKLEILYKASQRLSSTLDLNEIYEAISDFMAEIAPNDGLVISNFDPESQLITCRAFRIQNEWQDVAKFPPIPLEAEGKGTQSIVIRTGKPMLLNEYEDQVKTASTSYYFNDETGEVENAEGIPIEPEEDVTRSALLVPLKVGGLVTGVIQVFSYRRDAYSNDQLLLLEALSGHISSAEQNARLYAQVQAELEERKRAEERLRKSENRFAALFRSNPVPVGITRASDYRIVDVNRAWSALTGYTRDEALDHTAIELGLAKPNTLQKIRDMLSAGGEIRQYEIQLYTRTGQERRVLISSEPLELSGETYFLNNLLDITERKQAEQTLRETEERLALVMEGSQLGYWDWNIETGEVHRNARWAEMLGYTLEEIQLNVRQWTDLHHPDDKEAAWKSIRDHLDGKIPAHRIEYRMRTKEGHYKWILDQAKVVKRDSQGKPLRMSGTHTDITERKQAEEKLRESEEKYRGLMETLDSVVATLDYDGKFLYMNDIAARQLGGAPQALIGKTLHELFPEPTASQQLEGLRQVIRENQGRVSESLSFVQGQARWFHNSLQPIHDEHGQVAYVLLHATDIHELKSTQQELAELNRTLEERIKQATAEIQDLYDNAPTGYHSLDAKGRIVVINQTELNWLGYSRAELIGQPFVRLFTPASLAIFEATFPVFKQRGWLRGLELELVRKDGSAFPVLVSATAVISEAGEYLMSRSTVFDNTERKQAEEALRESEAQLRVSRDKLSAANAALERAARMKDEFLAGMSHELRTPLTGILGLSEALQLNTYGMLTEKQAKALKNIEESGRHLLALINDILDLSKIEAGMFDLNIELVSLSDVCQAALHLTRGMAHKKRQVVDFSIVPNAILLRVDARRLKQMLVNLLSNAIKFTPESGALGLDVKTDEAGQVVKLTVWDKGIGIAPENLEKLFQPFVQLESSLARQYEGTGLGLSLVQRMAELHGGSVQVESALGKGSRFTVILPWTPGGVQPSAHSDRGARAFSKVLVVDDHEGAAGQLVRYLHILGLETTLHMSGQGVVEMALRDKSDVILLDLHQPDRSGFDVLAELKANAETRAIPVIVCAAEEQRSRALTLEAAGYLAKPLTLTDLRNEINRVASVPGQGSFSMPTLDFARPKILIVDDNEIVIETLTDFLAAQDFRVVAARSGMEMLEIAPDLHPDVVLMDIQMPVMDGLEATRRIRAHSDPLVAGVPIIALTALAMTGDRERCLAAGANAYLGKPVGLKQLVETIRDLLKKMTRDAS